MKLRFAYILILALFIYIYIYILMSEMEVQEVLYKMRSTCCREEIESPNSTYLET